MKVIKYVSLIKVINYVSLIKMYYKYKCGGAHPDWFPPHVASSGIVISFLA